MYQYVKGDVLILRTYPGIGPIFGKASFQQAIGPVGSTFEIKGIPAQLRLNYAFSPARLCLQ